MLVLSLLHNTVCLNFTLSASIAGMSQAHSVVSNRKTSTISDVKGKDKHHGGSVAGAKTGVNTSSIDGATGSQVHIYSFLYFHFLLLKFLFFLNNWSLNFIWHLISNCCRLVNLILCIVHHEVNFPLLCHYNYACICYM